MDSTSRRRGAVLGFAFGAAFLAMSSVAFACTVYQGKSTVSDVNNGVATSAFSDGNGEAHGYCPFGFDAGGVPVRQPVDLTGSFTVTVGRTTTCVNQTSLAGGKTYDVRWLNVTGNADLSANCNNAAYEGVTRIGSITLDSNGNGSTSSVAVPAGFTAGEVNVCVTISSDAPSAPEVWLHVV